jgi:hypothetical protein
MRVSILVLIYARQLTDTTLIQQFPQPGSWGIATRRPRRSVCETLFPVVFALNTGLCGSAWDSYQDFKTFVANETGEHTKLRELFAPTRATSGLSGINKVMATFASDPLPAFQAPVTEIALATLKPGADSQSIAESVGKIVAATVDSGHPALGAALGSVVDDDLRSPLDRERYQLVLVTGWNSVEVCPRCAPINDISVDPFYVRTTSRRSKTVPDPSFRKYIIRSLWINTSTASFVSTLNCGKLR